MQHLPLTAADVMVPDPPTIGMDETLGRVQHRFDGAAGVHHLTVLDGREVVGVLSERDVLRALSPHLRTLSETSRDVATLSKRVHQVMAHRPLVATADTPVAELVAAFRDHAIGCIPIVDAERAPLGLVTVREISSRLTRQTAEPRGTPSSGR
ncbi:MAG: hypothetical protein JWR52_831 [Marmoricola sp.]|nr:hypothetical protein [Marmoricola sp.]